MGNGVSDRAGVVEPAAKAHGCTARVEVTEGEPAVVDDAVLARAVRALLPQAGLEPAAELRSCGSDDFGYLAASGCHRLDPGELTGQRSGCRSRPIPP